MHTILHSFTNIGLPIFALFTLASSSVTSLTAATVHGQVVDHQTGQPVARAVVHLIPHKQEYNPIPRDGISPPAVGSAGLNDAKVALAAADGRFDFAQIQPGMYLLQAERRGYLRSGYRAATPSQSSAIINVRAQADTLFIVRMFRPSVIAGVVLDMDGIPMASGTVQALQAISGVQGVSYRLTSASPVNDLGEYRISGLLPASYRVRFEPSQRDPMSIPTPSEQSAPPQAYVPTYYPSEISLARGADISIAVGQQVLGLGITARQASSFDVSGVIEYGTKPPAYGAVHLRPRGEIASSIVLSDTAFSPSGSFLIQRIPPGEYTLFVAAGRSGELALSQEELVVDNHNISGLKVSVLNTVSVLGTLSVEGGGGFDHDKAQILLIPVDYDIAPACQMKIGPGGDIRADSCNPGRYKISIKPPLGYTCTSIRSGSKTLNDQILEIHEGTELTISFAPGRKLLTLIPERHGTPDASRDPLMYYVAVARLAEDNEFRELVREGIASLHEPFVVSSLPAGRYAVIASEVSDERVLNQSEFWDRVVAHHGTIVLGDSEGTSISVEVVSAEDLASLAQRAL